MTIINQTKSEVTVSGGQSKVILEPGAIRKFRTLKISDTINIYSSQGRCILSLSYDKHELVVKDKLTAEKNNCDVIITAP